VSKLLNACLDVFRKGNDFGFAVAQPVFATALTDGVTPNDGDLMNQ